MTLDTLLQTPEVREAMDTLKRVAGANYVPSTGVVNSGHGVVAEAESRLLTAILHALSEQGETETKGAFHTAVVDAIVTGGPFPASAEEPHKAIFRALEAVKAHEHILTTPLLAKVATLEADSPAKVARRIAEFYHVQHKPACLNLRKEFPGECSCGLRAILAGEGEAVLAAVAEERDRLKEALYDFGQHKKDCGGGITDENFVCDCGLATLLGETGR